MSVVVAEAVFWGRPCEHRDPMTMLQKPVIEKPSATLGELENQVSYVSRPRGVTTASSEPSTKGLQSFIDRV